MPARQRWRRDQTEGNFLLCVSSDGWFFLCRDSFRRKFDTFKLSKYGCKGRLWNQTVSKWNVNLMEVQRLERQTSQPWMNLLEIQTSDKWWQTSCIMRNISYDKQVSLYSDQSIKTSRTTEIGGWVRVLLYPPGIPFISIKASLATCPCQLFLTDLQLGEKKWFRYSHDCRCPYPRAPAVCWITITSSGLIHPASHFTNTKWTVVETGARE